MLNINLLENSIERNTNRKLRLAIKGAVTNGGTIQPFTSMMMQNMFVSPVHNLLFVRLFHQVTCDQMLQPKNTHLSEIYITQ